MFRLWIKKGESSGEVKEFDQTRITVGRISDNSLQVKDLRTSRKHFQISAAHGRHIINDLKSRNGTIVNGKEIEQTTLHDGDEIQIGDTTLVFEAANLDSTYVDVAEESAESATEVIASEEHSKVASRAYHVVNLQYRDDGLYLIICAEDLKYFSLLDYENFLKDRGIDHYLHSALVKAYEEHDGFPMRISIDGDTDHVDAEKYIDVTIAEGAMKAQMNLYLPPQNKRISVADVLYVLSKKGVVYGIRRDLIRQAVTCGTLQTDLFVASGKEPQSGKDAQLNYKVNLDKSRKPLKLEDGRLDYKNIDTVHNIKQGSVLVEKTPPTEGVPGITVTGMEVPPKKGRDMRLPKGKHTAISSDGYKLIASLSGHLLLRDKRLHIEDIYQVRGNVDYSTGNIRYTGDVVVRGDVLSGFKVETDGNIYILGCVEGAEIHSAHGNIKIDNGVCGQHKARIIADEGDIHSTYMQDCVAIAGGNIDGGKYIMGCDVTAGKNLMITRGKGTLLGGKAQCKQLLECRTLGSFGGQYTEVHVNGESLENLNQQILLLENELHELSIAVKKIRDRIGVILTLKNKFNCLSSDKKSELLSLKDEHGPLHERQTKIQQQLKALAHEVELCENNEHGVEIRVTSIVYPGVAIFMEKYDYRFKKERRQVQMVHGDFGIKISPLYCR